jgi:hypothetical protein
MNLLADAGMQPHLGEIGLDLGDLDAVVDVNRLLRDARHIRPAMLAMTGQDIAFPGRVGMLRTMRPSMRLALGPARVLAVALVTLC